MSNVETIEMINIVIVGLDYSNAGEFCKKFLELENSENFEKPKINIKSDAEIPPLEEAKIKNDLFQSLPIINLNNKEKEIVVSFNVPAKQFVIEKRSNNIIMPLDFDFIKDLAWKTVDKSSGQFTACGLNIIKNYNLTGDKDIDFLNQTKNSIESKIIDKIKNLELTFSSLENEGLNNEYQKSFTVAKKFNNSSNLEYIISANYNFERFKTISSNNRIAGIVLEILENLNVCFDDFENICRKVISA